MTELLRPESQYDAFLFASVCETNEMTLSVLSVLARQDVDPWQEADRLAQLSRDQAISSLASKISKSNSERWSPSEASMQAVRLVELLPSHNGSPATTLRAGDGNGRLTFWVVAGMLFMSLAISGNSMQQCQRLRRVDAQRRHGCTGGCGDTIVPRNRNGLREIRRNIDEQQDCCGEHQVKTGIQFRRLGRWHSNTDRPPVAPGRQKSRCCDRCVGQGHCSQHSAAEVVRT